MNTRTNPQDFDQRTGSLTRKMRLLLTLALIVAASSAQATFIESIEQSGTNVVVIGSGTINTASLTLQPSTGTIQFAGLVPTNADLANGPTSLTFVSEYDGITGAPSFGTGSLTKANNGLGDAVGLYGASNFLALPTSYVSGSPLSDSSSYTSTTLATLGITVGTYTWKWGSGPTADSFILYAGTTVPTVPDSGSTMLLMGLGLASVGLLRRKIVA